MSDFSDVIDLIYSIRDKELLEDLLLGLTSPKEREELAQRIEIVKRLLAGELQHDIAAELGVGVATVTRASKELVQGRFRVLKDDQ
ncbi:MAG TPA: Trp family transcriptional regulator [Candidatus Saccharimonadales bacterium]